MDRVQRALVEAVLESRDQPRQAGGAATRPPRGTVPEASDSYRRGAGLVCATAGASKGLRDQAAHGRARGTSSRERRRGARVPPSVRLEGRGEASRRAPPYSWSRVQIQVRHEANRGTAQDKSCEYPFNRCTGSRAARVASVY